MSFRGAQGSSRPGPRCIWNCSDHAVVCAHQWVPGYDHTLTLVCGLLWVRLCGDMFACLCVCHVCRLPGLYTWRCPRVATLPCPDGRSVPPLGDCCHLVVRLGTPPWVSRPQEVAAGDVSGAGQGSLMPGPESSLDGVGQRPSKSAPEGV